MRIRFSETERTFLFRWITAALAGPAVAAVATQLLASRFAQLADNELAFIVLLVIPLLPKALLEWWALRPHIDRRSWLWIVASVAGGIVSTVAISVAQWLALRRWVKRAFWWPVIGYLFWFASPYYVSSIAGNELALIPLWLVHGLVTGWLMVVLLRTPKGPDDGHEFDELIRRLEERQKARQQEDG